MLLRSGSVSRQNMTTRRNSCIVIVLLLFYTPHLSGRICYHCDSRNGNCPEDSVNGTTKRVCAEGNDFCEVVKDGRHSGGPRFIRDCVSECDNELIEWSKDGEEYCHMCCAEDGCNVGRCGAAMFSVKHFLFICCIINTLLVLF